MSYRQWMNSTSGTHTNLDPLRKTLYEMNEPRGSSALVGDSVTVVLRGVAGGVACGARVGARIMYIVVSSPLVVPCITLCRTPALCISCITRIGSRALGCKSSL